MVEDITNITDKTMIFLRDPLLEVTVAILAIIVGIWIYKKQMKVIKLGYKLILSTPIINIYNNIENELQVSYRGKEVRSSILFSVQIKNIGNAPIRKDDFDEPIRFKFSDGSEVVKCHVSETYPDKINIEADFKGNVLTVKKLLINRQDEFTVNVITINGSNSIDITCRIIDGKLEEITPKKHWLLIVFVFFVGSLLTLSLSYFLNSLGINILVGRGR